MRVGKLTVYGRKKMNNKPKLTDRLYTTGMQFADCLRLLGKHEESHEVEVWVLGMVRELISKAGK